MEKKTKEGKRLGKSARKPLGKSKRKEEGKKESSFLRELEKLKSKYKIVGTSQAAEFIKRNLKLNFQKKSIENQIIRKKIGKVVSVGKKKIKVFTEKDIENLKKMYESYVKGKELRKKYFALGIRDLLKLLKERYKIQMKLKNFEALLTRLAEKREIKKVYEHYMGKKVLAFTKDTVNKIVSYIKSRK